MRRYDDPVQVRKGVVTGSRGPTEGPEQFLWHGRLWKVVDVVAHRVETGPWWQSRGAVATLGGEERECSSEAAGGLRSADSLAEREVWRVEAGRGGPGAPGRVAASHGVFELAFDWAQGNWFLTRCLD